MTEGEVNVKVKQWLLDGGYEYKGVLTGYGKIPMGDTGVTIDHKGERYYPIETLWVEAQGSCIGIDRLLNGFMSVIFACRYGDFPKGILAMPQGEYDKLSLYKEFLTNLAKSATATIGLLNVGDMQVDWLNATP
jgi:hypothetical protein